MEGGWKQGFFSGSGADLTLFTNTDFDLTLFTNIDADLTLLFSQILNQMLI